MRMMKAAMCSMLAATCIAGAASGQVVISQVYPGGGNSGAVYNADFVELFNRGTATVDISNWSVQYFATSNNSGGKVDIPAGAMIQPGQYFLVKVSTASTTNGVALPTPDVDATSANGAAGSGRYVLANSTTQLTSGQCHVGDPAVVDLVGYGTATCREGAGSAPTLSATLAAFRTANGCVDTNDNAADFSSSAPNPRNSASPFNVCTSSVPPSGSTTTTPDTACPNTLVTFTVNVTPGSSPASTGINVTGDFLTIGLTGAEQFVEGPTNTWTFSTTLLPVSPGSYNFPITITDAQSRVGNATATLLVTSCDPAITSGTGVSSSGVCNGASTTLTVVVQPGQNPTSASINVTVDLSSIGGSASQMLTEGPANTFTYTATVANGTPEGTKTLNITVTDDQLRMDTGTFTIVTGDCVNASSQVVISQVYGGGGNSGATLTNDFIELFNRGTTPVDITGWSVQYSSASDSNGGFGSGIPSTNVPTVLSGIIPAGGYFLVQQAAGAGGTQMLPTPDATGAIAMGAGDARVVLVSNADPVLTNCADPDIVDLVGYGSALCGEGSLGNVPSLNNTTAALRKGDGCQDSNQNRLDFDRGTPNPRNSASPINNCGGATTGACCQPGGSCSVTTSSLCMLANGTFQGVGTVCSPNPCPQPTTGACCCGSSCTITTAAACTGANRSFAGAGTVCTPFSSTMPCCRGDYNKSGAPATVQDIFDFLSGYFSNDACADSNDSGGNPTVQDIFDFLAAYFGGGC